MAILLTGADGQVGWEVARLARRRGLALVAPSRAELDITRPADVAAAFAQSSPGLVVNAAAYTAVDGAESDQDTAFAANRDGVAHLADSCREAGVPLIHLSTDYVFDGAARRPWREDDPVAPLGAYGASKEAGERALRERWERHLIVRTAWLSGAHGRNFVKAILGRLDASQPLRVVDDQTGCPTFAADLAETVLALAARARSGEAVPWGTYHYCGAGETTWCGFAREIVRLARPRGDAPEVQPVTTAEYPTAARRPAYSVLDCGRIETTFGITRRPWREGLARLLDELATDAG